jgi:hypothetical protein
MSYSSADFQEAVLEAFRGRGLLPVDADPQTPEEAAGYVLEALDNITTHAQRLADPDCGHTDTAGGICLNCGNDEGAK